MNAGWAIFGTVISSVIIYILSEFLKEIWIEPIRRFKAIKEKVSIALTMYAREYTDSNGNDRLRFDEAREKFRLLASEIDGFAETRNRVQPRVPKRKNLKEASRGLIGLSNSCGNESAEYSHRYRDEVVKCLGLISR